MEWISVKDRLPEEKQTVRCFVNTFNEKHQTDGKFIRQDGYGTMFICNGWFRPRYNSVTHWHELLPNPKQLDNRDKNG